MKRLLERGLLVPERDIVNSRGNAPGKLVVIPTLKGSHRRYHGKVQLIPGGSTLSGSGLVASLTGGGAPGY